MEDFYFGVVGEGPEGGDEFGVAETDKYLLTGHLINLLNLIVTRAYLIPRIQLLMITLPQIQHYHVPLITADHHVAVFGFCGGGREV